MVYVSCLTVEDEWGQESILLQKMGNLLAMVITYPCYTQNIRIHHECEGGIEKSVPRIAVWHHEACRVMTNCDHEGQIIQSHPRMNYDFFSCSLLSTDFYDL